MKRILILVIGFSIFLYSCGGNGEQNQNEDPTGNERGTPGTGTGETGTGQEPNQDSAQVKDSNTASPADSVQPGHSH